MWDGAAADLVVVVHLMFIGFVVGGAFLAWRWPRVVWAHIPAAVYGALVEFAGFACPLTSLEQDLRRRAGEAGYRGGFIAHYLVKVIYPPGLTRGMQVGLGVVVLLVAAVGYLGFLRRQARASRPASRPAGRLLRARRLTGYKVRMPPGRRSVSRAAGGGRSSVTGRSPGSTGGRPVSRTMRRAAQSRSSPPGTPGRAAPPAPGAGESGPTRCDDRRSSPRRC